MPTTNSLLGSPLRNLAIALALVATVFVAATVGYVMSGWNLGDALYMVTVTIFSVGYDEVRPIDTSYLRVLTTGTIVLGCTGMIVLTGALVQVFTAFQLSKMLGLERMQTQIDRLNNHVIICGFGRIGLQLATALHDAKTGFVVIERDAAKVEEAKTMGFLYVSGDATEEGSLEAAGVDRADVLATVLPDDAANVFITLSARNLNGALKIIARGEAPTTRSKLLHAGANNVILPTHIGAERIAEMILYPTTARFVSDSPKMREMRRGLREFGLELQRVTVAAASSLSGETVHAAEQRGQGAFFIVQIDRADGKSIAHPSANVRIEAGDNVVLVVRSTRVSEGAIFSSAQGKVRAGRSQF